MIPVISLYLPIVLSAVFVFVVSSIIHMLFAYHRNDFVRVPSEDEVMDALRAFDIPPGNYVIPCAGSAKAMKSPEYIEKLKKGPVGFLTIMASGQQSMAKSLVQWFIYCLIVGVFAAYIAGRALEPGAHYLAVFRFIGAASFIGYTLALWQNSIWYKRKWSTTLKSTIDGFLYALVTAGTFGWLWPG